MFSPIMFVELCYHLRFFVSQLALLLHCMKLSNYALQERSQLIDIYKINRAYIGMVYRRNGRDIEITCVVVLIKENLNTLSIFLIAFI